MELIDGASDELLRSKFAWKNPTAKKARQVVWMTEFGEDFWGDHGEGFIMFYAHLWDPEREFVDDPRICEWIGLLYREQQLPPTTSRYEENLLDFATRMSRLRLFTSKRVSAVLLLKKWARDYPDTKFRVFHSYEGGFGGGVLLVSGYRLWNFATSNSGSLNVGEGEQ